MGLRSCKPRRVGAKMAKVFDVTVDFLKGG